MDCRPAVHASTASSVASRSSVPRKSAVQAPELLWSLCALQVEDREKKAFHFRRSVPGASNLELGSDVIFKKASFAAFASVFFGPALGEFLGPAPDIVEVASVPEREAQALVPPKKRLLSCTAAAALAWPGPGSDCGSAACSSGRWASIRRRRNPAQGKRLWLGTFDTADEAAAVYDTATLRLKGDQAVVNFPSGPVSPSPRMKVYHSDFFASASTGTSG